ncbi:Cytochrome P450 [Micromonospora avicenniae]|uniref:Cytochrome P450 n=1 Tax=Micromonospora avicenniae TaxID=1198245 RepID=A0A1N7D552_9ACTN|nr:Cytochrome P450 [Micromonospora avicenniae]
MDPRTGCTLTRYADVRAALAAPACHVPAARPGAPYTLDWFRGLVSRFSAPQDHPARRAAGLAALAPLDPDELRAEAARRTADALDRAGGRLDVASALARRVPVGVLAGRLGLADAATAVDAVATIAAAYQAGADAAAAWRADGAVTVLVALAPPAPPEALANRLGLLVQACDATAGLIGAGARHLLPPAADLPPAAGEVTGFGRPAGDTEELLHEVLRLDPPVRGTRRTTTGAVHIGGVDVPAGTPLLLRFDSANRDPEVFPEPDSFTPGRPTPALTFGAGPRGCPGQRHALALATGVLDVLRERCRLAPGVPAYEPHPLLRVPTRLEVIPL